jgi:hypothetical protein
LIDEPDGSCFPQTQFEGTVSDGDFAADVTFVAIAGQDCRLVVDPFRVDGKSYVALSKAVGQPGGHVQPVKLTGTSVDNAVFSSNHMYVDGTPSGSEGFKIRLTTGEASIVMPRQTNEKETRTALKFSLRGFKSFRPRPVKAELGQIIVRGGHKLSSSDEVSGEIIVLSDELAPDEDWHTKAEDLAEFIWKGLQFGHGGRLQVPLLQVFRPERVTATFYRGAGRPHHLPAIHYMDQSAFIEALVRRFEDPDAFPDAVWQAVGWLNNDSSIDEVRFLTLMTAIETILDSLVPTHRSTIVPKTDFEPIRDALIDVLSNHDLTTTHAEIFANRIKGLNQATLSNKLQAVIEKYDLPTDLFAEDVLRRLNKQRVSIIHRGIAREDDNLWQCILLARELIARVVFAELRFKGTIESYAEGYERQRVP